MLFDQITVVGVGLIGGSVGLAARARGVARRLVGVDRDAAVLSAAERLGAIDAGTTSLAGGVAAAQLVVVCTPVDRVVEVVVDASAHAPGAIFTDAGSVKGGLWAAVERVTSGATAFVPAHPLAGAEKNGVAHARADLFENRVTVLTPERPGPEVEAVAGFWTALGARVVRCGAAEHDRVLAFTSHLPHAVAGAVAGVTRPDWLGLSAGGFRDVTRIAAGDPHLWAAIFEANRPDVLAALAAFAERLNDFRALLTAGDRAGLVEWLAEGKQVRDALGT
jgi:prephenate dehydrogenase